MQVENRKGVFSALPAPFLYALCLKKRSKVGNLVRMGLPRITLLV